MRKEKKGISLIVLVITIIVIIILAVAAILSIANNNPIENSKEARFRNDMKVIEEELNLYIAKKYADDLGTNTVLANLDGENMVSALPSTKDYKDKVKIVGGNLELTSSASDEERDWAKKIGIEVEETVTLKVGDEITYQNEPFYIIGGDTVGTVISTSTQNVLLLAKYNLTSDGKSQDKDGNSNPCAFSDTNYWSSVEGIAYPDADGKYPDLNDVEKYPIGSATSIITTAKTYGSKLGVTGRLMTYEEANTLRTLDLEIFSGNKDGNKLDYWLGSAGGTGINLHAVYGSGTNGSSVGLRTSHFDDPPYDYGVRPVIEVPKSLVQ